MQQVDHAEGEEYWDESIPTVPTSQLRDALVEYGSTGFGQAMLRGQIYDNARQRFILVKARDQFAYVSEGAIFYNPSHVPARDGSRASDIKGSEWRTSRLSVSIAHEFGHTAIGWNALRLPPFLPDVGGDALVQGGPNYL